LGDITDYAKYANIVRYSGLSSIDVNQNFVVMSKKRIFLDAVDEIDIITDKEVVVAASDGNAVFRIQKDGTVRVYGDLLVSGEIVASSVTVGNPSNHRYVISSISDDRLDINNDDLKKFYKEEMINIDMLYPDGDEEKPITDKQIDEELSVYEKDMVLNVLVTAVAGNKKLDLYLNELLSVKQPRVNLPAPTRKIKMET
jgi:hypothetical protein